MENRTNERLVRIKWFLDAFPFTRMQERQPGCCLYAREASIDCDYIAHLGHKLFWNDDKAEWQYKFELQYTNIVIDNNISQSGKKILIPRAFLFLANITRIVQVISIYAPIVKSTASIFFFTRGWVK